MRIRLLLILVMALWGSAFASSKAAVAEVPHEVAGFLRFLGGTLVLLVVLRAPRLPAAEVPRVAGLGMVGVFGYNALFFLGLSLAPAADGSVIVPMAAPICTVAVSVLLGRVRLSGMRSLALFIAVTGGIVFFVGIPDTGDSRLLGDLMFLGAAACWSAYTLLGAPLLSRLPAATVTVYATAAGTAALGMVAVPAFGDVRWSELSLEFWLNQAYLAALPTALAYVLYYRAVGQVGPTTATSTMFLVPAFGLTCAWVVLGESIAPLQGIGAGLMFAGAWINTRPTVDDSVVPTAESGGVVVEDDSAAVDSTTRSDELNPSADSISSAADSLRAS
ncbi:DMT family transporter [Nocardia bhagyanarayanae]|uniref:Drug/metabolite transporter (DMT)-like permease n=1 Tax=Nocardia bhagyanarayanae TaxID=1215925 RepID=A0A543FA62_9NOCA|nr:DMT family transporter [Nocardia bhagyanarayanae]TQM30716.1 drug/metabolite transporter (DMT)-like permease [Nocardia bhagyanarayanae]